MDIDVARRLMLDAFGVEGSERTLCREVRRLQGGHCMWLRQGRLDIRRWWRTVDHLPAMPAQRSRARGALSRALSGCRRAADAQRRADRDLSVGRVRFVGRDLHHGRAREGRHGTARQHLWRHAFVATFPGASNDERPMAEEAAAWADVAPTFLEIGQADALTDLDRFSTTMMTSISGFRALPG